MIVPDLNIKVGLDRIKIEQRRKVQWEIGGVEDKIALFGDTINKKSNGDG